jgi:hypothetical protein
MDKEIIHSYSDMNRLGFGPVFAQPMTRYAERKLSSTFRIRD